MAELERVTAVPPLPNRPRDGHKGTFGRVFVIGGSRGMTGAPCLAAMAALRSGAGLVQVGVPAGLVQIVAAKLLEPTIVPLSGQATLEMNAQATIMEVARGAGAVIFGPGLGPGPGVDARFAGQKSAALAAIDEPEEDPSEVKVSMGALRPGAAAAETEETDEPDSSDGPPSKTVNLEITQTTVLPAQAVGLSRLSAVVVQRLRAPLILDADGLNAIAPRPMLLASRRGRTTVITPHPGEMAKITGLTVAAVQQDREKIAAEWALKLQSIVVLKGAGTVVTDGQRLYVNTTGNSGMGTGGSGDVLSGVIGALIGQGMSGFEAAVLGVHAHGLAGDLAAADRTEMGLIAGDLVEYLPRAWQALAARQG